jgi:hypothetical protein
MPIEFRCSQCGKLLRTGDDTAGKQAQCPACGTVSTVPTPVAPPEAVPEPPAPPSPFATTSPWGESPSSPFAARGQADAENPYQAPPEYAPAEAFPGAFAQERVSAPATGLIVVGAIGLVLQIIGTAFQAVVLFAGVGGGGAQGEALAVGAAQVAGGLLGIGLSILVIYAGTRMKNLENYGLAMTGAIVAMIPCFPCCLLGLPFGIWAIVVLVNPEVKAAFR